MKRRMILLLVLLALSACAQPTATPVAVRPTPDLIATGTAVPTATLTATVTPFSVPTVKSEVPRISAAELKQRLDAGEDVVIVDARSREEYLTLHIAGAISIPLADTEGRLSELPRDKDVVFYCT